MHYVLELEFEPGTDADARQRVFDEIGATGIAATETGRYVGTVSLDVESVSELQSYTDSLVARPEVNAADVVAMRLPIRSEP